MGRSLGHAIPRGGSIPRNVFKTGCPEEKLAFPCTNAKTGEHVATTSEGVLHFGWGEANVVPGVLGGSTGRVGEIVHEGRRMGGSLLLCQHRSGSRSKSSQRGIGSTHSLALMAAANASGSKPAGGWSTKADAIVPSSFGGRVRREGRKGNQ